GGRGAGRGRTGGGRPARGYTAGPGSPRVGLAISPATDGTPAYTLPATTISAWSAVLTAMRSTWRSRPPVRACPAAAASNGMPRTRAKSLPFPAGMIPYLAPAPAATAASGPAVPSPPTATTTWPAPAARVAISRAWSRLAASLTSYVAPAASSEADAADSARSERPRPATGLTTRQNGPFIGYYSTGAGDRPQSLSGR